VTYFRDQAGNEVTAVSFFETVVAQWEYLLKREKLLEWEWDAESADVSD
jgi:hypothetical protein